MRTIIDIPEEQLKPFDTYCNAQGISRAFMVRKLIAAFLNNNVSKPLSLREHPAFGMCTDNEFGDGLEYQRLIRAEWDERDRAIDERFGSSIQNPL